MVTRAKSWWLQGCLLLEAIFITPLHQCCTPVLQVDSGASIAATLLETMCDRGVRGVFASHLHSLVSWHGAGI